MGEILCAYVSEGTDLMFMTVLGTGIFKDFSVPVSSEAGSVALKGLVLASVKLSRLELRKDSSNV